MAIYHFSVKTISRSTGRTATAAAAYRAGESITDRNTGEVHNYNYKNGVLETGIVLPSDAPKWMFNRENLWNEVEGVEKRKNSTVAREIIVALPAELDESVRARMVRGFAEQLAVKHQCAVDFAIHEPNSKGDDRNYHAHLLLSTRRVTAEGFTEKTREWDDRKSGTVEEWRAKWAEHANRYLAEYGIDERISHLSLAEQGIEREPTKHKGVAATAIERRNRTAIQKNPKLNNMEKSRALRVNAPQVNAQPEPLSGYNFGQEPPTVENIELTEIHKLLGAGKLSDEEVLELFKQSGEIASLEMDLHWLMDERSELVREMEAQKINVEATAKIGQLMQKLTPEQRNGLAVLVKTFADVRDKNDHLPYTDRLKQFGESVNHLADEAIAGRNLAHLEMIGRTLQGQQQRPQHENSENRSKSTEIGDGYDLDR